MPGSVGVELLLQPCESFTNEHLHQAILLYLSEGQYFVPALLRTEFALLDAPEDDGGIKELPRLEHGAVELTCHRRLVPKESHVPTLTELVSISCSADSGYTAEFTPVSTASLPYFYPAISSMKIEMPDPQKLSLCYHPTSEIQPKHSKMFPKLLAKLAKVARGYANGYEKQAHHDRITPKVQFQDLYRELRGREYLAPVFETWPDNGTDPLKDIYEDLAIATWLILLWKQEKSTRYVDLGCGNGLLVYILASEGYTNGFGVEMTRRKQWDVYEKVASYREETVDPRNCVYPNVDWIIGNHPDELSLWVPIIAARSNMASWVVIPCCYYQLSGEKFSSSGANGGRYEEYCRMVESVAHEVCGYSPIERDHLRIPSTKNLAIVGRRDRVVPGKSRADICDGIDLHVKGIEILYRVPDKSKRTFKH
ncbi:MAG: hypothetical protein SGCHY_001466 [Lobulomycetales sp.]